MRSRHTVPGRCVWRHPTTLVLACLVALLGCRGSDISPMSGGAPGGDGAALPLTGGNGGSDGVGTGGNTSADSGSTGVGGKAASGAGGSGTGGARPDAGVDGAGGVGGAVLVSQTCSNPSHVLPLNSSNPQDGITLGGFYVDTDTWNAASYQVSQTMYICDYNNWYVVARMNNDSGDGAVKTYPNVHKDFDGAPAISSFGTITSSFAHTAPHVGIYEFAYDIWLNGVASKGSTEVMIWTDNYNQVPSGTVNLLSFFNHIIAKGWIPTASTVGAIDYGVELVSTGGVNATFQVNDFSLTAD